MRTHSMLKLSTKVFAAIVAIASLSAASHAQNGSPRVKANIPFAFETSQKHLAAGVYTVQMETPRVVKLSGTSGSSFTLANPDESLRATEKGKLVFTKQGDRYTLKEIWLPGQTTHVDCINSKKHKTVERASNDVAPTEVEVAMMEPTR